MTASCVLEHLHAEPVQVDSHDYYRKRQRHKQTVIPVVLDGGQESILMWRKQLGHDGNVEETHEQCEPKGNERRADQLIGRKMHLWISQSCRSLMRRPGGSGHNSKP
uniref:Uncharacterized protein n=1 Tax=Zea mays TaxID=4577 RepID=C4J3C9_MAIZE|nr:unknown [Zea mays]